MSLTATSLFSRSGAQLEANFTMEARAHIQLFHQYFFNLPPDNDYIKWTVGKAMYMADGTALEAETGYGRERILLGYNLFIGSLHNHLRFDQL